MSSKRTGLWRSTRTLGLVLGFASVALVWNPEVAQAQNVNSGVKASISDGGVQLWFLADRFGDVDPDGGPCPDPREIGATCHRPGYEVHLSSAKLVHPVAGRVGAQFGQAGPPWLG